MKLEVPYIEVCDIDESIIDAINNAITEEDWFVFDYRQQMGNMQECNSIVIRHSTEYDVATMREMPLFDKYYPLIEPILNKFKDIYTFNEYSAFLSRLAPQGIIGEHRDGSGSKHFSLDKCHRIHAPIKTNSDVFYSIDGVDYNWVKGKIYEFDNMRIHGVKNQGDEERIHLVINLYNLE